MTDSRRRPTTVRVALHLNPSDPSTIMFGVTEQTWNGPVRLDRRLLRYTRLGVRPPAPSGVPGSVWLAHLALSEYIAEVWERNHPSAPDGSDEPVD